MEMYPSGLEDRVNAENSPKRQRLNIRAAAILTLLLCFLGLSPVESRKAQPKGLLALSAGDSVTIVDVGGSISTSIETGPVGFLFPAPGGVLFAPDLIDGRTSVIDMRRIRLREVLPKLMMPRFTVWKDRYLVLAGDLLMLSYPERSLVFRMEARITRPWQIYASEDGMSMVVLERNPEGKGPSILTALDLGVRKQVFRKRYSSDFIRFAEMEKPGVLVLADRSDRRILVLDPQTLAPMHRISLSRAPTDLLAVGEVLFSSGDEEGIRRWKMERNRKGEFKVGELDSIGTGGIVMRMAISPDGIFLAAACDDGKLRVYEARKARLISELEIPPEVRDLVWVDPLQEGPLLPLWSDQGQEMPEDIRPLALRKGKQKN